MLDVRAVRVVCGVLVGAVPAVRVDCSMLDVRAVRVVCAVLAALLGASAAGAHEFWLSPVAYPDDHGADVPIYAFVGEGLRGEPVRYSAPYAASFLQVFTTVDASTRPEGSDSTESPRFADLGRGREAPSAAIDLAARASHGDVTFARLEGAAGSLVSFVSHFSPHEMDGAEFDAYLEAEGLSAPLAARAGLADRDGVVRERFRRSAKLWLPGPGDGWVRGPAEDPTGSSPRVGPCVRLGLPLEISPLDDLAGAREARFQVWYAGAPLGGAWVRAWHAPDVAVEPACRSEEAAIVRFEGRTAEDGTISFAVDEVGEWLVAVVHMVPSESADADWESTWSSFTFHHR
jgi:hypothetical protein